MHFLTEGLVKTLRADQLNAYIYRSSIEAAVAAAEAAADEMRNLISGRGRAIGLFALSPSQNDFPDSLVAAHGIEWTRVIGIQLNEYLGLEEASPESLRKFLINR